MAHTLETFPGMKKNISLAPYTSFRIGGPARYFFAAKTDEDVGRALSLARSEHVPIFILGGGTNILVSDKGFSGLVIQLQNEYIRFEGNVVSTGSGTSLQKLIDSAIGHSLAGIESLSGIGGTVGGAVRGNAGAFGQTIGERVQSVNAFHDSEIRPYTREECQFRYRESIFKKNHSVILSAAFMLFPGKREELRAMADEIIQKRQERYNSQWQCAGCVFKNIDLGEIQVDKKRMLRALDITEKEYDEATKYGKLPVSFITDRLGLKGKGVGGAKIAEEHGAFIINTGGATAEDVVMLMAIVKTKVRNLLGIQLEAEIELVGF